MDIAKGMLGATDDGFAITPHDTNPLDHVAKSIWVGVSGDLCVVTVAGTELTYTNVPVGLFDAVHVKQVKDTGTDADGLIGHYNKN